MVETAAATEPGTVIAQTESVCPQCLARIPAVRIVRGSDVFLSKTCSEHELSETVIWRGSPDIRSWVRPRHPVHPARPLREVREGCPFDCGLCPDHRQQSCCVLLEVTQRCDLCCEYCFASAGGAGGDPDLARLSARMQRLFDDAGPVNLQLSGGEPCVRDDLPEIAARAREIGFKFVQVNSNGLRLAREPDYAQRLRDAGVATIFLQFDGTRDDIHERMRGRPLLDQKITAIGNCGAAGLGVVLVPVVVPGINADDMGPMLDFALEQQPVVRGLHFQPVSYFGRYPTAPTDADRITLPEIVAGLEAQSGGRVRADNFQPAGAENALCSFSGTFVSMPDGRLFPLTRNQPASSCCSPTEHVASTPVAADPPVAQASGSCCSEAASPSPGGSVRAREYVARSWSAPRPENAAPSPGPSLGDWDVFLARARTHALMISGMAFQDAWTLDLDRLRDCHIHIADPDGAMVPFCAFNLTRLDGRGLYRSERLTRG